MDKNMKFNILGNRFMEFFRNVSPTEIRLFVMKTCVFTRTKFRCHIKMLPPLVLSHFCHNLNCFTELVLASAKL